MVRAVWGAKLIFDLLMKWICSFLILAAFLPGWVMGQAGFSLVVVNDKGAPVGGATVKVLKVGRWGVV